VHYRNAEEELHSVVIIIEEKAERSIKHALKIYQVNLTSHSKTMRDNGSQPSDWSITQLTLYADRAQVREQFSENAANIVYSFANSSVQCSPLRPSDITESMVLKICYPLHKVDVNCLLSDDVWWRCNDHGTVSIDNHSKHLIPLIYL
jgi:regulation of enolase protein 1 (concanavalin A-like superfamily)